MIEGSCLCGKVHYQYDGEITELSLCHCSQCRQAQGSAFAAVSPIDDSKLKIAGVEHIKEYQSSSDKVRAFCRHCGSALYSAKQSIPGVKRLRVGTITSSFNCENQYHIHAGSVPEWHRITDEYRQYPEHKPTE